MRDYRLMVKKTQLLIRLDADMIAKIDALRGEIPRAAWIRNRLGEVVVALEPRGKKK